VGGWGVSVGGWDVRVEGWGVTVGGWGVTVRDWDVTVGVVVTVVDITVGSYSDRYHSGGDPCFVFHYEGFRHTSFTLFIR